MKELLHKRTLTSKTFQDDNLYNGKFHIGHIHYPTGIDKNGVLDDIDTTLSFNASSGLWSMTKASYDAEIDQYGRITFHNVSGRLTLDPLNTSVQAQSYTGNTWGDLGKALIWRDVLGLDMHMYCEVRNGSLVRIFRFERKPSFNTITLKVDMNGVDFPTRPGRNQERTIAVPLKLDTVISGKSLHLRKPRAWNHRGENVDISFRFYDVNDELFVDKVIPQTFIDATFTEQGAWLETDDTASYYPDSTGDGKIAYDTYYASGGPYTETWNDVRTKTDGSQVTKFASSEPVSAVFYSNFQSSGFDRRGISRLFFPFDTSGLDDAATIVSANFALTPASKGSAGTVAFIQTSQASPTTLTVADYDAMTINTPTEGATRTTISSDYTVDVEKLHALNANGLSWINVSGWTYLGLREGTYDVDNSEPSDELASLSPYMANQTGTDKDPRLDVTYVLSNTIGVLGMSQFSGISQLQF